jgi:hypothetical protein
VQPDSPLPLQPSMVHGSRSSQSTVPPGTHWPAWHVSAPLHGLPSPQAVLFGDGVLLQPDCWSHSSAVQPLLSLQASGDEPLQTPFWQVSTWVQASRSLHDGPVRLTCVQAPFPSQPSVVHGLLSLQSGPEAPRQRPSTQESPVEQTLPSEQVVPSAALLLLQPATGSHESSLHGFWSSQSRALPGVHAPALHTSEPLHTLESVHVVPSGCAALAGQVVAVPEQASGASHAVAAGRHTVPALPAGCEQAPLPLQVSAVQALPSSVQPVPAVLAPSGGQERVLPLHDSARSHSPVAGRHTAPVLPAGCWHVPLVPLQASAVQGRPSDVQGVSFTLKPSGGQIVDVPVQVSARSHSPPDAGRQTWPTPPAGC